MQAPIHDVATAAEVLEGGGYRSLPAAIEELQPAAPPAPPARAAALRLMDQMLRSRLLQVGLDVFKRFCPSKLTVFQTENLILAPIHQMYNQSRGMHA